MHGLKSLLIKLSAACFLLSGMLAPAQAAVIGSSAMLEQQAAADTRAELGSLFARADVREQLQQWGVDAADVDARLAALTDAEVAELALQMEQAPAGEGVVGVVGVVFVVLLILELVGVTDIFKSF